MNCPRCGAMAEPTARFCVRCGAPLASSTDAASGAMLPETPPTLEPAASEGIVSASLRKGWRAYRAHAGTLIGALFAYYAVVLMLPFVLMPITRGSSAGAGAVQAGFFLLNGILGAGLQWLYLRAARGERPRIGELFAGFELAIPLLLAQLMFYAAFIAGLVVLVIPGVVIALGLSQYALLIMDRRAEDPVAAIKGSWEVMRGYKLRYIGLLAVVGWVNLLGLLALVVGLLVTVPFTLATLAAFYDALPGKPAERPRRVD